MKLWAEASQVLRLAHHPAHKILGTFIVFLTEIDDLGFLYNQLGIKMRLQYTSFLASECDDEDLVVSALKRRRDLYIRTGTD